MPEVGLAFAPGRICTSPCPPTGERKDVDSASAFADRTRDLLQALSPLSRLRTSVLHCLGEATTDRPATPVAVGAAVLAGKLQAMRKDCSPVAGKSTLNRLELSRETATRYHKIAHDPAVR